MENSKKNITLMKNLEVYSPLVTNDHRLPSMKDIKNNREFNLKSYDNLEASNLNPEKLAYGTKHLIKDLNYFINYLPAKEMNRIVRVIIWLLCEAMKNYGFVYLADFGSFRAYDRITPVRYNLGTRENYSTRRMKVSRKVEFRPNNYLLNLITPRTLRFANILTVRQRLASWPGLFNCFVSSKKQDLRGKYLIQDVFTRDFFPLGYSWEYIELVSRGEIREEI